MSSGFLLCLLYISLTQWLLLSNFTLALIMKNKNKYKKRDVVFRLPAVWYQKPLFKGELHISQIFNKEVSESKERSINQLK